MSNGSLTPFPSALVLDTSFLRTIGGTENNSYQTFSNYVADEEIELFLGQRVVEELEEQRGYISIDWTDRVSIVNSVQPGVRVHDGPRAGEVMDRVQQRLAKFEHTPPDELRKTDAELAAVAVMLLGSTPHELVSIVMDDKNAERSIGGVIDNTYYEGRIRARAERPRGRIPVTNIWDVIDHISSNQN